MVDIVTFPCEYMVFTSGHEERLFNFQREFEQVTIPQGIVPLGLINWSPYGAKFSSATLLSVRNGTIDWYGVSTEEERITWCLIVTRLKTNKLHRDCIILRTGTFSNVMNIIRSFKDINYYPMYGLPEITFLRNEENVIDLAFVTMNAESG